MKVVSILILAVAAVYAYSDDGDYHNDEDYKQVNKQEKKRLFNVPPPEPVPKGGG